MAFPAAAKEGRDHYGAPGFLLGEHVALRWGDALDPDPERMQAILSGYDQAFVRIIEELAYPAPQGCDSYLFNVYYYDTGAGTPPPKPDGGGTSQTDPEGYYYVLMPPSTLVGVHPEENPEDPPSDPDSLFHSAAWGFAHEFFHAVQLSLGFPIGPVSGWYTEATAEWIPDQVTDQPYRIPLLISYLLLPNLPLNYRYPAGMLVDDFVLPMGHRYGAAIFVKFLEEHAADADLIRDSFLQIGDSESIFDVLDRLLTQRGTSLNAEFTRFAAHNVAWDYEHAAVYRESVEPHLDRPEVIEYDYAVTQRLPPTGTTTWTGPPWFLAPQYYGYNVIEMRDPAGGDLQVEFLAAPHGNTSTPAGYGVTLVRMLPGGPEYRGVPLFEDESKVTGAIEVPGIGEEESIYLVVAAWGDRYVEDETFPYVYQMYIDPVTDPPEECPVCQECEECQECETCPPSDCPGEGGCSTGPLTGRSLILLLGFLAMTVRRRPF